jgi:hypothetical protein
MSGEAAIAVTIETAIGDHPAPGDGRETIGLRPAG